MIWRNGSMSTPADADDIPDSETVVTAALDKDSSANAESQPPNSVLTITVVADSNTSPHGCQSKPPDFLVRSS